MSAVRALTATRLSPWRAIAQPSPLASHDVPGSRICPPSTETRDVGPRAGGFDDRGLRPPSGAFSIQPMLASSFVFTKT